MLLVLEFRLLEYLKDLKLTVMKYVSEGAFALSLQKYKNTSRKCGTSTLIEESLL